MNRLKIVFSLVFVLVFPKLLAQPLIKYSNGNPEYSIQWDKQFAQINNLTPEIEINDKWVSVKEFKNKELNINIFLATYSVKCVLLDEKKKISAPYKMKPWPANNPKPHHSPSAQMTAIQWCWSAEHKRPNPLRCTRWSCSMMTTHPWSSW